MYTWLTKDIGNDSANAGDRVYRRDRDVNGARSKAFYV